jgi:hypothetical protein
MYGDVSYKYRRTGQADWTHLDRQSWTGRTGRAELDRQNWTDITRQAGLNRKNWTDKLDRENKTGRIRLSGHVSVKK